MIKPRRRDMPTQRTARIAAQNLRGVGFSCTSNQIMGSLALAKRIKEIKPGIRVLFGGPSLSGAMGVAHQEKHAALVDPVFPGEADDTGRPLPHVRPLPYESSRGCWWAEKSNCSFCGFNGPAKQHRLKSPPRVLSELEALSTAYAKLDFIACDNNLAPRTPSTSFR